MKTEKSGTVVAREPDVPVRGSCGVCGQPLARPVAWCAECGAGTHEDCFVYAGRCPRYACTGMRFRIQRDAAVTDVKWIERREPDGTRVPQAFIVEFVSAREKVIWGAVAGSILLPLIVGLLVPAAPMVVCVALLALGALVLATALTTSDYRVIDGRSRSVYVHWQFMLRRSLQREATFDEISGLRVLCVPCTVIGEHEVWPGHRWTGQLEFSNGVKPLALCEDCTRAEQAEFPRPPSADFMLVVQRIQAMTGATVIRDDRPMIEQTVKLPDR